MLAGEMINEDEHSKMKKFSATKQKLDENNANRDIILLAEYLEMVQKKNGIPSNSLTSDEVVRLCKKKRTSKCYSLNVLISGLP